MNELNGTVAVITGAGRGIGREIALHQAQGGAKVAVLARTAREIDETASLITGVGGVAIAIPVDLVDRLAVEDALARVAGELGAIDLLVNNHGSFRAFGPIWECDPDVWWQDVEINLRGTFLTCRDDRGLLEQEMEDIVARDARALRFSGVEQAKLYTHIAYATRNAISLYNVGPVSTLQITRSSSGKRSVLRSAR
jgi:NAD(P)-dependent dehydrogenase (short-subunit alcohol dehydrogenase family)